MYTQTSQTLFTGGYGGGGGIGGCSAGTICDVASTVLYVINDILVPLIFAIAFLTFIFGLAKAFIFSAGRDPEEVTKGNKLILWGLIAFAVMISIWGLVNVVANTFGLDGYHAPELPTSY